MDNRNGNSLRVVLFATGNIDDATDTDLSELIINMRLAGAEIITVGVGSSVSRGWLETLAAAPEKALLVTDLQLAGLQSSAGLINGRICEDGKYVYAAPAAAATAAAACMQSPTCH